MMKKKLRVKQFLSGVMAVVTLLSTAMAPVTAYATEPEKKAVEYPVYEDVKDQLEEDEVVTAKDYEIEVGADFDVEIDFAEIEIPDDEKVKVTFHEAKNEAGEDFSTKQADTYKAVYYVEPVSGHPSYRIQRDLIVKEVATKEGDAGRVSEQDGNASAAEDGSEDAEESDSQTEVTLPEGEPPQESEETIEGTQPEITEDTASKDVPQVDETTEAEETDAESTETESTEVVLEGDMVTADVPDSASTTETVETKDSRDFDDMSDEEICIAAKAMIQAQMDAGEYELEFFEKIWNCSCYTKTS